jgi:predicted ATPase
MNHHVILSGCSGGGKSALLAELARRGFAVVVEPGRRIVEEEMDGDGAALPWVDPAAFARRAIEMALADRDKAASAGGWVFFDRGLIDAVAALEHATGEPLLARLEAAHRYHHRVFFAPPWAAIHRQDEERRHGFREAVAEHDRLLAAYTGLGYTIVALPLTSVAERADFVIANL